MSLANDTVRVRIPGSTSNCGAGFDTLGLALSIYNHVTVSRAKGAGAQPERPSDARAQAMVEETADAFFRISGLARAGFRYRIEGDVPSARGLGSSVTVIAGVLTALEALHGAGWPRAKLVAVATEIEGHPDNASAGILGGFCVSRCDPNTGAYIDTVRIAIPTDLAFVVASPAIELLTKESRGVLPATLPYFDAVKSVNSAAYFTAAMATGDYEKLRHAVTDFLHEPYRLPKIPGARAAIVAGVAAGAYTGWLSGSGSSVICVSYHREANSVLAAMRGAFERESIPCEARILKADNAGMQLD